MAAQAHVELVDEPMRNHLLQYGIQHRQYQQW